MSTFPTAKAHPWHGVSPGASVPDEVFAYIELVPGDTVKYEIDKTTGHLRLDRPQKFSNQCPTLYGFVPQTYCGDQVGARASERTGRQIRGDGDPLDICVLTERTINHGDIIVRALPIGGLRMIDKNEADDKIIAVLCDDAVYGGYRELSQCPPQVIDRIRHYFLTYKQIPSSENTAKATVEIFESYDASEARNVITTSLRDYQTLLSSS